MNEFKDHFSGHADVYREARPTYPPELFIWLAKQAPDRELAWDCGCGRSQTPCGCPDCSGRTSTWHRSAA